MQLSTKPGRYRKTAVVEAKQISTDTVRNENHVSPNSLSLAAIVGWMNACGFNDFEVTGDADKYGLRIQSLEGWVVADPGDWICRGVEGEFWRVREDIFAKTYEEVED